MLKILYTPEQYREKPLDYLPKRNKISSCNEFWCTQVIPILSAEQRSFKVTNSDIKISWNDPSVYLLFSMHPSLCLCCHEILYSFINLFIYLLIHSFIYYYLFIFLSINLFIYYLFIHLLIFIYLYFYLSIYLSIYSFILSVYLFIHSSIYL